MNVRLNLACPDRTDEDVQSLVQELTKELNALQDVEAATEEVRAPEGTRGDLVALGNILVNFLTGGGAAAVIKVIQSYLERQPTLSVTIQSPDGRVLKVDAKGVNAGLWKQVKGFLAETSRAKR